jgi:hypothetical protein
MSTSISPSIRWKHLLPQSLPPQSVERINMLIFLNAWKSNWQVEDTT